MNIIRTLKDMLCEWYLFNFSYADNRLCLFLEKFLSRKVVRPLAFSCYCLTMILIVVTLAAMMFSYAGKLVDIILNRGIVR